MIVTFIRITPAYAGKTLTGLNPYFPNWDHPRVCGENRLIVCARLICRGSPPRMRGKLIHFAENPGAVEDHPRVCGENGQQCYY